MHVSRRHGPTKRGVVKGCGHMILKHCIIGQCQTGVLVSSILSLSSLLRPSILGQTRQCSNISPDSCCRGNLILCELMCVSVVIVVYCAGIGINIHTTSLSSSSSSPFPPPPSPVSSSSLSLFSPPLFFSLLLFFLSSSSFSSPVAPLHLPFTHSQHALLFCR